MTNDPTYPFQPRSLKKLEPGHFWAIPLSDDRYACGLVVATKVCDPLTLEPERGAFMAALLDWSDDMPPNESRIRGVSGVLRHGYAHLRAITMAGDQIRGLRDLEEDPIELPETVTHRRGGTVWVVRGDQRVRPASRSEAAEMDVSVHLGFSALQYLANSRLANDSAK